MGLVLSLIAAVVTAAGPSHADYDADGDTDIAVFRPSNGTWYVHGGTTIPWGTNGDIPVPGDYDGDGDTDIATFRPSSGTWFVHGSPSVGWGTNGDIPVPGDYDGDRDTDMALFRPSNGTWFVLDAGTTHWGTNGDIPEPGDYDGDGDTDIVVFRPSNGTWYIAGGATTHWGTNGDIPAATAGAWYQAASKPRVFAHWHHSAQRAVSGYNDVAAYRAEVRKAKTMGIDGFAYNVINVSLELPEIENLYTAAHLEGNFYLFPEADQCCGMTDAQIDQLAYFKYTDPARLRVDGGRYGSNLPVMQVWHGAAKGTSYWKSRQDAWNAAGKPQYFIPFFHPTGISVSTLFDNWDGSVAGQSDDLVDGLDNFSGWASLTDPHAATTLNHQYDVGADSRPGMDAMFGCAPVFNRHSGPTEVENRIIGNFEGFTTWISCLQGLVADNPRFIQFPTWNDYLEGSYLGGPYPRDALWANYRGNEFSHDAFREIGQYYLEWFKTARQPRVTTDLIAIAHRPHPKCAPGPHPGADGSATCAAAANDTDNAEDRPWPYTPESTVIRPLQRQVGATSEDDMLYGAVILKSPGTVTLTSGTATMSFDRPAGVSQVSMPFGVGTQSIKLERSGALVTSATSEVPIVANPNLFNYNVATAHARR